MNLKDLYIDFFVSKGHKQIPSAPVVPENDPSVLFNTAGMQPLIPYLMGQPHPYGTRLVDYQKCIRTNDLDSVGDKTHHTFFEMLGNWSLGDYFKEESISYSFEFLTKILNIPVEKIAVTVFAGDNDIPRDEVSFNTWKNLGIDENKIAYLGKEDNFWIAGESGPCGPDTEIFYFRSDDEVPSYFDPKDERWVEIWNNVFMQYYKNSDGKISDLPIIDLLLEKSDDFPYSEERRLFYVAMTRSKKKTFLLTINNNKSIFISELEKEYDNEFKYERFECPKCGGRLIRKKGKFGYFFGCSNYPTCKYTKN